MRTIEEAVAELRKDIHSDVYLGKKTIGTYLDEILEIHNAEKTRWIPCNERLPKDNTLVLVTVKVGNREPKVRSGYYYMNGHFHIDNGDCWEARDKELIAWMPLPTPPNKSEIPTGQIAANGELYPGEFDDPLAEEGSDKE